MKNNYLVCSGAVNWAHPEWRGSFYPEDLPDDWMLSYYNTHFQAVYLRRADWQSATGSTWARWLYETQDNFVFLLEPATTSQAGIPVSERILLASPEWSEDHLWWLDENFDLRALSQRISSQAARGETLFVISRSGDLQKLQAVDELRQVMGY
jgi:hypothetical protein